MRSDETGGHQMGDRDDRAPEPHDEGPPARRRGRATDGRPYVMVLAVAPWPSMLPAAAVAPAPTTTGTTQSR